MAKDMFEEAVMGNTLLSKEAMKAERYVATNRFKVREGKGPAFEKRWAERKSRLATLDGFRFFSLLRRVDGPGAVYTDNASNYISLTVWENKDNFEAWKNGDAFKEAHGGGGTPVDSIFGFVQLLSTALFILEGGPKPGNFIVFNKHLHILISLK